MKQAAYSIFETPLGWCGIAWCEEEDSCRPPAVAFFQLPEATPEKTESRISRTCGEGPPSPPPSSIAAVIEKITRHLQGEAQDFRDIPIDLEGVGPFDRQVYKAARSIP